MPKTKSKKNIKVRDLKPKKDAKGGSVMQHAATGAVTRAATGAATGAATKAYFGANN